MDTFLLLQLIALAFSLSAGNKTNERYNCRLICVPVISQYRNEEDLCKKEEKKAKLLKETIPFYLNKFEQTVGENGSYTVGSTVSRSAGFNIKILTVCAKNSGDEENLCQVINITFLGNFGVTKVALARRKIVYI